MIDETPRTSAAENPPPPPKFHYEQTAATYATQFLVTVNGDGILLDCSSGAVFNPGAAHPLIPVHTRLAIPAAAVPRLVRILGQAAERMSAAKGKGPAASQPSGTSVRAATKPAARFPKLKGTNG